MQSQALTTAVERCADPQRARTYAERLQENGAGRLFRKLLPEQARILAALLSGSQWSAELLLAHPDWLPPLLELEAIQRPRSLQGLRRAVEADLTELAQ